MCAFYLPWRHRDQDGGAAPGQCLTCRMLVNWVGRDGQPIKLSELSNHTVCLECEREFASSRSQFCFYCIDYEYKQRKFFCSCQMKWCTKHHREILQYIPIANGCPNCPNTTGSRLAEVVAETNILPMVLARIVQQYVASDLFSPFKVGLSTTTTATTTVAVDGNDDDNSAKTNKKHKRANTS
jgi:hypothetical protein